MSGSDSTSTESKFGVAVFGEATFGGASSTGDLSEVVEELQETIENDAFETIEDRLRAHLKPAFDEDGDEWSSYLSAYADEYTDFADARAESLAAQYVETASGGELDRIGEFAHVARETGENDPHYRQRIIVQMQQFLAGGTIPEIRSLCAVLLQTDEENIEITEDFGLEPARFDLTISQSLIDEAGVTASEFVENLWGIRAAGVRPVITTKGSFTYRSYEDYQNGVNDPEKGYNNGEYAGRLRR